MYCLMCRKTTESYEHVLRTLKSKFSNETTVNTIMSDYERPLRNAIRTVYPNAAVFGCWFHFARAIFKKARALHLLTVPNISRAIKMAMSLPLLPQNLIQDGINAVVNEGDASNRNFLIFIEYLKNTWTTQNISVFQQNHRTNNAVESYHRTLFRIVGTPHPNVWIFIKKLRIMENSKAFDFIRLTNGVPARRPRIIYRTRSENIARAQQILLIDGDITQFLKKMTLNTRNSEELFQSTRDYEADDVEDVEAQILPDQPGPSSSSPATSTSAPAIPGPSTSSSTTTTLIPSSLLCVICLTNPRTHIFSDCGHFISCESCASQFEPFVFNFDIDVDFEEPETVARTACPVCRTTLTVPPRTVFT